MNLIEYLILVIVVVIQAPKIKVSLIQARKDIREAKAIGRKRTLQVRSYTNDNENDQGAT